MMMMNRRSVKEHPGARHRIWGLWFQHTHTQPTWTVAREDGGQAGADAFKSCTDPAYCDCDKNPGNYTLKRLISTQAGLMS